MGWWTGRTSYNSALSQIPTSYSGIQEKICNVLILRGDPKYGSLTVPPSKEWNSYCFQSFIATFLMLCFIVIIICLLISRNTSIHLESNWRGIAPSQQRCSRVLNPFALLFLPLPRWRSGCHFATIAAAQIPDFPRDLTPISPQSWGRWSAVPTSYQIRQINLPVFVALQCYTLPMLVQWTAWTGD